jgi:RNA polymerase sigma-70 factor (ECF subfamily)
MSAISIESAVEYGRVVVQRRPGSDTPLEGGLLAAALAGDSQAFQALTDPYIRELHVHCYRLLGSFHDAEDALQETLLRAWRHLASFEGRSTFRAWLYRIATNVSLTQRQRTRAQIPFLPQVVADAVAQSTEPRINLSPYPDALLDELTTASGDPVADAELRESVHLAFLAAAQLLPPRQRAVLILRDVVGFSADAVAGMLESTTASVNSALNRARATLQQQRAAGRLHTGRSVTADDVSEELGRRYGEAFLATDIDALVGLLKRDVVLTMPPLPLRLTGLQPVAAFLAALPLAGQKRLRIVHTRANRQPALAVYVRDEGGDVYRAWGITVLSTDGDSIAELTHFVDAELIPRFGLLAELT